MILYDASESGLQQKGEKNFCFIASSLGKKDLGFFVVKNVLKKTRKDVIIKFLRAFSKELQDNK